MDECTYPPVHFVASRTSDIRILVLIICSPYVQWFPRPRPHITQPARSRSFPGPMLIPCSPSIHGPSVHEYPCPVLKHALCPWMSPPPTPPLTGYPMKPGVLCVSWMAWQSPSMASKLQSLPPPGKCSKIRERKGGRYKILLCELDWLAEPFQWPPSFGRLRPFASAAAR
eukprot:1161469-Pelagomonas_calceolata.AAC.12